MRPVEVLLLLANSLTLLQLVAPLPRIVYRLRHSAPIALLIAVTQIAGESSRWQMVPAYTLTGLFFLVWLFPKIAMSGGSAGQNRANWFAYGPAVLGLAVSIVLPVLIPVFHFPHPSGPYKIGTLTYHWVDADRPEVFTFDSNDRRELMVQIWYPAKGDPAAPLAPYVKNTGALVPLAHLLHLPGFTFGHLKYIATNAILSAPVANDETSYPVLIFSHGRGGFRQHNTWQVEELVSHGYIVAAIDHPYAASGVVFPDGRLAAFDPRMLDRKFVDSMIPYLTQDAIFTLNQLTALNQDDPEGILTGRLDLQRAGIFGLSLGGEVSAEASRLEPRIRACLIMDVWMPADVVRSGLKKPTMWISRDAGSMRLEGWAPQDIDETQRTMRAVFQRLLEDGYLVRVPGMFHQDFSDAPLLSPLTSWLGVTGPINGRRAHCITSDYSLAFFNQYLKGRPETLLDGPAKQYPEVLFERR